MKKTQEQESIINNSRIHNRLKVDAVAGSGKTTTLSMVTEEIKLDTLLLVYNKSAREDAENKFPSNVECRTTHSLAYRSVGINYQHKLKRPGGKYKNVCGTNSEVAKYFKLEAIEGRGDKSILPTTLGFLVRQCVAAFESSDNNEISEKHLRGIGLMCEKYDVYKDILSEIVLSCAKKLWKLREDISSNVLITHDTYLKIYQLSKPILNYEMIMLDEAQDSSDCVLDILKIQRDSTKIILVGDTRQGIYQWRGAVNAMKKVNWKKDELTTSFRYGPQVANLASKIINRDIKSHSSTNTKVSKDCVNINLPYTKLYRSNAELIHFAVNKILEGGKKIHIEIDTVDFCKKLSSFIALYNNKIKDVKHDAVVVYESWDDVIEDSCNSKEVERFRKIVENNSCYRIIKCLNEHVNDPSCADIVLTTAHKSKGREWPQVILAEDFPDPIKEDAWVGLPEEEENLLYVACTRAIDALNINKSCERYLNKFCIEV